MSSLLSSLILSNALISSPVPGSSAPEPLPEPEVAAWSWVLDTSDSTSYRVPGLTLTDDGHAGGHDGCNSFRYISFPGYEGPMWTPEGNQVVFHGMRLATMMGCQGHDDTLAKADTFILDGDNLLLFRGEEFLGTMVPA
ncbi:hypothetical protein COCCU_03075 [Corynebacterium occultum]|uniref:META domain protein n=1 Tax=Corynebacterium occultum TaxID=2675219 RepID=A0A6B8VTZ5_9CORY|nr:hypothetical protein COCCU_03075 [Corynebacterium occultum]